MVLGILGNMWLCPGPYIPELGASLQLAGAGATEWQAMSNKKYDHGQSRGIKTVDAGSLES